MSENGQQKEEIIPLGGYLPRATFIRAYLVTQTNNLFDGLKRLCDLGLVEYAVMVLTNILTSNARSYITSLPFKVEEFPVNCICIDERNTDKFYMFIKTIIPGDPHTGDVYCYAFDIVTDKSGSKNVLIRACSYLEYITYYDKVKQELQKHPIVGYEEILSKASIAEGVEEMEVIDIDRMLASRIRERKHNR